MIIEGGRIEHDHLGKNGRVELLGEQEAVEVFEGEEGTGELGEVSMLQTPKLLDERLGIGDGGAGVALDVDEEAAELLGVHVRVALGVGREGFLHIPRRLRLLPLEPAGEAQAHPVAPHRSPPPPCSSSFLLPPSSTTFSCDIPALRGGAAAIVTAA